MEPAHGTEEQARERSDRERSRQVRERRRAERRHANQRIPIQTLAATRRRLASAADRVEDRLPPKAVDVIERLRAQDVLLYAASLAFYALISIVPFMVVGFALAGMAVGSDRIEGLAGDLTRFTPVDLELDRLVRSLLSVSAGVGLGALLTALWPATAYGGGLARALDSISVDRDPSLHGLRGRLRALAVLAALPLFLLGAMVTGYLAAGVSSAGTSGVIAGAALAVVGGVTTTWVGIVALYWWFGPVDLEWRALAGGAGAAAVAITLASSAYLLYVGRGANWEEQVAGASVAAMILLALWFYLVNLLLLAGYCAALALDDGDADQADRGDDARDHVAGG